MSPKAKRKRKGEGYCGACLVERVSARLDMLLDAFDEAQTNVSGGAFFQAAIRAKESKFWFSSIEAAAREVPHRCGGVDRQR